MKYPISLFVIAIVFVACQSDYTKLVKSELSKGVRQDSVLLGIYLGDTRNDFHGRCFDLNKEHLVMQGDGGSVQYLFTDSLVHRTPTPIKLLFVPAFDKDEKITNMDLNFSYASWSPANKELQVDSLKSKISALLMKWYGGNEFIMADVEGSKTPVKVDGNRRIMVLVYGAQSVVVRVQDILHPKFKHPSIDVSSFDKKTATE